MWVVNVEPGLNSLLQASDVVHYFFDGNALIFSDGMCYTASCEFFI